MTLIYLWLWVLGFASEIWFPHVQKEQEKTAVQISSSSTVPWLHGLTFTPPGQGQLGPQDADVNRK